METIPEILCTRLILQNYVGHHELFMARFSHSKTVDIFCQLPYNDVDSPCLLVLGTIGFMETLVEVNESTAEATLNVSLTLNSSIQFEIMFPYLQSL